MDNAIVSPSLEASSDRSALATSGSRRELFSGAAIRSFGLLAIMVLVWGTFQVLTGGIFLHPRNLTNLSGQVAITAILSAGVVLVMVPGYIDLSIGATVSFCAVIAAIASTRLGLSAPSAIALTLGAGLLIGAWHAIWVAWLRVPAFIVTLASLLAIRGVSLAITSSETLPPSSTLLFISDYSVPPRWSSLILILLWLAQAFLLLREHRALAAAKIAVPFATKVVLPVLLSGLFYLGAILIVVSYRGIPLPVVILLAVVGGASFVLRYTSFGRRIYAIGGNRQAAALAGINIGLYSSVVFIAMGFLYAVAGLVLVARLDSAPPGGEVGLELNVIAAAVLGGTSLLGGKGTVLGAIIGALLMESLSNGMSLLDLPTEYQSIAVGLVLLLAVFVDTRGRDRPDFG